MFTAFCTAFFVVALIVCIIFVVIFTITTLGDLFQGNIFYGFMMLLLDACCVAMSILILFVLGVLK